MELGTVPGFRFRVRICLFLVVNFNKSINKSENVKEMGGSFVRLIYGLQVKQKGCDEMKSHSWCKIWTLVICLMLVCLACAGAAGEAAADEFTIEGTTLVKYNGPGGEVTVPDGIEKLGTWAFDGARVTKVNLPETLKEIDSFCFFACYELTDITLPASLTNLEYDENGIEKSQIFAFNSSLSEIKVAEGNPNYKSIDGVLFTADGKKLLYYPDGKYNDGEYAIPEGTVELGYSPFSSANLKSISIPSTMEKLDKYDENPFTAILTLEEINVSPDNKKYYSIDGVLYKDNTLISYPASKSGTELAAEVFPEKVTNIALEAFACNRNLVTVEIPEGVEYVGWMSFCSSPSLESVTIPASVKEISAYAFDSCRNLQKVVILNPRVLLPDNSFIEEKYREINKYIIIQDSDQAVLYGYDNSTTQAYAEKWGLKFESLGPAPEEVSANTETEPECEPVDVMAEQEARWAEEYKDFEIKGNTLVKYKGSGGEVTVPYMIEVLGESAFYDSMVTKVNLPRGLKEIRSYCFWNCPELCEITLPASLRNLEYYIDATTGYVPIQAQVFSNNPKLEAINVEEGNPLYKSIDGVLFSADGKTLIYYPDGKKTDLYIIPEGTEELGYTAFSYPEISAIHLPSTLRQLHSDGGDFSGISTLKGVYVSPENQFYYSVDGVLYSRNRKSLIFYPNNREETELKPEDFQKGIINIGAFAFQQDKNLKTVELPEGIEVIDWMAFSWAKSLESVTVPASVGYISGYAFVDCHKLEKLVILNPNVNLPDDNLITENTPWVTLYGYENSTVQAYAEKHNLKFESLGPAPEE